MSLLNPPAGRREAGHGPDWLGRAFAWVLVVTVGIVLGFQYWNPHPRIIPVMVAILTFGVAWRLDMAAAISLLVFVLPYPKGTVFGNTNLAFILLVLVIWLLRVSLRQSPRPRASGVDLPILGMFLWYILSFYNVRSADVLAPALMNFGLFIACVAYFYLLVNGIRTQRDLQRLHAAQLVTAFIVFAIAAIEARIAGQVFIPGLLDFRGTLGSDFNTRDVRVGASFRDYELLSEYCGITFLLTLFMWVRARSQTQRWLFTLYGLFSLYTLFTTVTRGIVVALMVALPYLFFVVRRRLNAVRLVGGLAAIAVLAMAMNYIVARYTNSGDLFLRMAETRVVHGVVPEARAETWRNAWERALVHPILGQGPLYREMPGYHNVWPHNVYLFIANVIGFPGLLFFLLLLAGMVRLLRPVVDDLRHASYADAYLIVARTQLFVFMLNELKIDFLRNPIYVFQVWMWFGTWVAAYLVSRTEGVRSPDFRDASAAPAPRELAA
jgi:hypothetical protein